MQGYENWRSLQRQLSLHGTGTRITQTYRETEGQELIGLERVLVEVSFDECLQAVGAEVKEGLTIGLLLLFRKPILGLCHLELAATLQGNKANTKVCSAYQIRSASDRVW